MVFFCKFSLEATDVLRPEGLLATGDFPVPGELAVGTIRVQPIPFSLSQSFAAGVTKAVDETVICLVPEGTLRSESRLNTGAFRCIESMLWGLVSAALDFTIAVGLVGALEAALGLALGLALGAGIAGRTEARTSRTIRSISIEERSSLLLADGLIALLPSSISVVLGYG